MKNESIALSQYTIIIDGHNLAFYLYNLQHGQHLSQKHALTLVNQLSEYLKSFRSANPEIELCFDGGVRPPTADPARVRILAAGAHNTADNLILDRFRYHAFSNHPCLVITNDAEIQEILDQEDGHYLNVFDFVLLPHPVHPVFLPPEDLLYDFPELTGQSSKDLHPNVSAIPLKDSIRQIGRLKPVQVKPLTNKPDLNITQETPDNSTSLDVTTSSNEQPEETFPNFYDSIHYRITLSSWPVKDGVRFLLTSFCSNHRPQFINLLESFDLSQLRPDDLAVLAEFLLATCSAEPDFTRRGSLMDRVRLALLKAGDAGLNLGSLAQEIGVKPEGLQGRIKRKAKGWLSVRLLSEKD